MRRAVLLLALVLFVPAGGEANDEPPVRLIAVGDFGVGGETQRRFGAAVRAFEARNPADVLVALGDNDYTGDPSAFDANWEASFAWTRAADVDVTGVLGNHDVRVEGGRYQFDQLQMPRRYFRRAVGPIELYLLDSNNVDAAQTTWLRRTLARSRSRSRWRIAVSHHPAFSCGKYASHPAIVRQWVPLFERFRVRLVLAAHDHNYQRFAPRRGVRYVLHGGGNPRLYPLTGCPAGYPKRLRAVRERGFLYLVVRGGRLDGYAVTPAGRRTDHFVIRG